MKRLLGLVICCVMLMSIVSAAALTPPENCPVPEEKLHEAVLAYGGRMGASDGEFMAEGHIVLGCEESADAVEVYASIRYQEYGFMAGIFTDVGSGCGLIPVKMTFAKPEYHLVALQQPNDGEDYGSSIARMLPDEIEENWGGTEKNAQLEAQMESQARAYVASIGRTEMVMDWRKLDPPLELAGALVMATNALSRLYAYPLWVTEQEAVEDGERYRYEKLWEPDGQCDGVTYTLSNGRMKDVGGDTGTLIFRKTRMGDGVVMEDIVAEITLQGMNVSVKYPDGSRCYRLRVCEGNYGTDYALESVTDSGAFALKSEYLEQLDADFMRLNAWTRDEKEPSASIVKKAQ